MKKVGIMGGTFSPIHFGHLMLAETAYDFMELDEIWFIPSADPPHKMDIPVMSYIHRSRMTELAIEGISYFKKSDFESGRKKPSYTAETLRLLHIQYPNCIFYFIMGADSLFQLETWYKPEIVMTQAVLLVAVRDHHTKPEMTARIQYLKEKYSADIHLMDMPEIDLSSAMIRERIKNHQTIRFFVPEKVREYILNCHLYEGSESEGEIYH